MFLLGFENMNRSSGTHESPSSTVDYGLLKLIRDIKQSRLRRQERRLAKNQFLFYVRIS